MKKSSMLFVFISVAVLLTVNLFAGVKINPKDFAFFNKKFNIACPYSKSWALFTKNSSSAPDDFKDFLKAKKNVDESPLVLGAIISSASYSRFLYEEFTGDTDSYIKLLIEVLKSSEIEIIKNGYSENHDNKYIIYSTKLGEVKIKFIDFIYTDGAYAYRLSFWTLDSLFDNYTKEYFDIANRTLFLDLEANDKTYVAVWEKSSPGVPTNTVKKNNNKYIFYTVNGTKNKVYILGSIHVGSSSMYPLSDEIENAFDKTNNVVVEMDVSASNNNKLKDSLQTIAQIPDNKLLSDLVSKDTYQAVSAYFNRFKIPESKYNRYKPWFISTMITVLDIMKSGYNAENGTEKYFLAKINNKKILELESLSQQVEAMEKIDDEAYINTTLLGLESSGSSLKDMMAAWESGDEQTLEKITFKNANDPEYKEYYDGFFYKRNDGMVKKIETYLNDSNDYFVIVGSGHVIGEKGIISQLKKLGYKVSR